MTLSQANRILDRVREGEEYPLAIVNRALMMCGDLE